MEKIDEEGKLAIRAKLKRLNTLSLGIGAPGLLLQGMGASRSSLLFFLASIVGTAMLIVGLAYYAQYRGRHWAFGLLGLASCLGTIILYFIGKKCLHCHASHGFRASTCTNCGAPLAS